MPMHTGTSAGSSEEGSLQYSCWTCRQARQWSKGCTGTPLGYACTFSPHTLLLLPCCCIRVLCIWSCENLLRGLMSWMDIICCVPCSQPFICCQKASQSVRRHIFLIRLGTSAEYLSTVWPSCCFWAHWQARQPCSCAPNSGMCSVTICPLFNQSLLCFKMLLSIIPRTGLADRTWWLWFGLRVVQDDPLMLLGIRCHLSLIAAQLTSGWSVPVTL